MSISMRWVGMEAAEDVARTRALCYGGAARDLPRFVEMLHDDQRAGAGDFLLTEEDGAAVGTLTSFSMTMWMRAAPIPCQGIAWVGTIKTHRRGGSGGGAGIAGHMMASALRLAREREQSVSALMPFRGSFYEKSGFGIVERRCEWTIPIGVLPAGSFQGVRFYRSDEPSDRQALAACRQRQVERGQCDIERTAGGWEYWLRRWEEGLTVIDEADGACRGYLVFTHLQKNEKDVLVVTEAGYDDIAGLRRLLHFISSLRDQYSSAMLTLPADLPLNRLLRETQIPHRLVNHPHCVARPFTRMSIRILDHRRVLESLRLPVDARGRLVVSVRESEGSESRFSFDFADGRASVVASAASPDVTCADTTWAAIVSGDLPASQAARLGLADIASPAATSALDCLATGPLPFCKEYF